jgi:predicted transcriptional regulator
MDNNPMLELEVRKGIFQYISLNPGVHFREIQRALQIAIGALDYHLKFLEKNEVIAVKDEGHYRRYYPRNKFDTKSKSILSFLRQEIPRGIILFLIENKKCTHSKILSNFSISGATLSYHLKRMQAEGLLKSEKKGREIEYELLEDEKLISFAYSI